jgi:ornithine carbamoyltransferase
MKEEENVEWLFASARRAECPADPAMPSDFVENVLRRHRTHLQENKAFLRASILSVTTALVILGTALGINIEMANPSGSDDQESAVELAYSVWDPIGN